MDGTRPDNERVIPKTNTKIRTVKTHDGAPPIDRVATISSDKSKAVKFAINNNSLTLTVINPDAGTAVEKVDVSYEADDLEVGFNARYLLDIASQISGDTMTFILEDPGAPALINDSAHEDATYVLMPMRV
jgi:DNA polymerase sliding clamp subunit (PCNA homolog)